MFSGISSFIWGEDVKSAEVKGAEAEAKPAEVMGAKAGTDQGDEIFILILKDDRVSCIRVEKNVIHKHNFNRLFFLCETNLLIGMVMVRRNGS